jgi:FkbM family methyltransferase
MAHPGSQGEDVKSVLKALILLPLRLADAYSRAVARLWPSAGFAWTDLAYGITRDSRVTVHHSTAAGSLDMTFYTPNAMCRYRTDTFSTKEPETLEWIDRFGGNGALYDIGANVGLYSVYYAKSHSGTVYAFEPSVLNLGLLAKNISINDLSERVVIVPNPLTSENQVAPFHLSMLDEGGSMSTFGAETGHDGAALETQLAYATTGMSLDFMVERGLIPQPPTMIKIDVDGIEHLVLRGAAKVLALPGLQTVLIEVNDDFMVSATELEKHLQRAGFTLVERRHSEMFTAGIFASTFNQVWVRDQMTHDVGAAIA